VSTTRVSSDDEMRAWRIAGRLICTCSRPLPRRVAPFDAVECRACGRRIIADPVGLINEVLDALDA